MSPSDTTPDGRKAGSGSEPVEVRLLDKDYLVACPLEERDGLLAAARLLDERLRQMRAAQKVAPLERVAVLAALNLSFELLQLQQHEARREGALQQSLGELNQRLDWALELTGNR